MFAWVLSVQRTNREKYPATPDTQPFMAIDFTRLRQFDQLIEHIAMHQCFEIGAHLHVRGRLLRQRINHYTQ